MGIQHWNAYVIFNTRFFQIYQMGALAWKSMEEVVALTPKFL